MNWRVSNGNTFVTTINNDTQIYKDYARRIKLLINCKSDSIVGRICPKRPNVDALAKTKSRNIGIAKERPSASIMTMQKSKLRRSFFFTERP